MRVLLTGAGGFVGHHTLAHFLKTTDWDMVVTDSFRHRGTSARLRSVFDDLPDASSRVKVVTHDLTTPIDHITADEFGDIDVVVNMASESHVDRSIRDPRPFVENNVGLALSLLEWARDYRPRMFLQISTDEVYGPAPVFYRSVEWDTILPSNPYSASKAAQEALVFAYWRTYNLPVVITNTMNIIGERQDREKFIPTALACMLAGEPVPVHALPNHGKWVAGSRFYLHARNQADALRYIIEQHVHEMARYQYSPTTDRPPKYHVVGEREVANDDMVRMLADMMGGVDFDPVRYVDVHSSRPGHDARYAMADNNLTYLGWAPPIPLEESLQRTVQWYLRNKEWLRA